MSARRSLLLASIIASAAAILMLCSADESERSAMLGRSVVMASSHATAPSVAE